MRQLRFATQGAAEGWARVAGAASPYLITSEASVLHEMAHNPNTLARFVVAEDGEVLGVSRLRTSATGETRLMIQVDPAHTGRGVGSLLLARMRAVAGDVDLTGIVNGDEHSTAVAAHWGVTLEREHTISVVDPSTVAAPGVVPDGLVVVPLSEAGVEAVWQCHEAAAGDDPSGLTRQIPFDEYAVGQWAEPDHRPDLGRAVMSGDVVLAYGSVTVADDRSWNSMTGTRPTHRGLGLATLAKRHSLVALAAAGVTRCFTGNDAANVPMLAVNEALGYRRTASTWGARLSS
ncbi:GNAT family N-acetyltransferase [Nocardioides sp. Soil796]|uniref:GNAT family N-acetyltransferase n=1 Tax=Nocardioides sp. Soil796 TaxID=1736412 RepID=UPI00070ED050|nr:GNAT family N-acetyltransferase [Nocardioides sp. Soil796]KRF20397.1 hypothetical protein ASH02_22055 [Nocardioides sp. Soil796]